VGVLEAIKANRDKLEKDLVTAQELRPVQGLCYRKVSSCTVYSVIHDRYLDLTAQVWNGPADGHSCSNVRGGCGCIHGEQKMAGEMVRAPLAFSRHELVLMTPWSPCTHCANLIVALDMFSAVVYDLPTPHDTRGVEILKANDIIIFALDAQVVVEL
jgi:deoxycytidylate deaminase